MTALKPDQRDGWQPIETAPKTGLPLLLWDPYYLMRIGRWEPRAIGEHWGLIPPEGADGQWVSDLPYGSDPDRGEVEKELTPTHWMPLPEPPRANDEEKRG